MQEALIHALARISVLESRGASSLDVWPRRIVINQAISTVRSIKRCREDALDAFDSELDRGVRVARESGLATQSVEDSVADEQTRVLVLNAIKALPDSPRLPLYLRDIEGFHTAETAKILEISQSNVRTRLHRARQVLKDSWKQYSEGRDYESLDALQQKSLYPRHKASIASLVSQHDHLRGVREFYCRLPRR